MKKLLTFSIILFISVFTTTLLAQSSSGKLAGQVVDAETQEPLIGANIMLINTSFGAACDMDGNYFILNITPSTYDIKVSFVGYTSKIIQGVRIVPGITYELNATLTAGIANWFACAMSNNVFKSLPVTTPGFTLSKILSCIVIKFIFTIKYSFQIDTANLRIIFA